MTLPVTEHERDLLVEALEAQEEILRRMSHDAGVSEETRESARRDASRVAGLLGRLAALALDGVTDEALARMDWAAGLTDDQLEYLKKGLVLLQHAADAFRARLAESEITRLADELEALP